MTDKPDTRTRLINAALSVLSKKGFDGTTMRAIAKRAGLSLGLAYYHFKTKNQLLTATIAVSREHFLGTLERTRPPKSVPGQELVRGLLELSRALVDLRPAWYRLCTDMDALSVRSRTIGRIAARNKAQSALDVRSYLALVLERLAPGEPAEEIEPEAAALMAAFEGLAVRKLIDPTFDIDSSYLAIERWVLSRWAPGVAPVNRPWNSDVLGLKRRRTKVARRAPAKKTR